MMNLFIYISEGKKLQRRLEIKASIAFVLSDAIHNIQSGTNLRSSVG